MLKSRKIISMLLAIVMALSIGCVGVFADGIEDTGIISYTSNLVLDVSLNNPTGSQSNGFETTAAESYFKVWIDNTSAHKYTVVVTSGSTSGPQVGYTTVAAGTEGYIYSNGSVSPGDYWVSVTSSDGYALSGRLAVRRASSQLELGSIVNREDK